MILQLMTSQEGHVLLYSSSKHSFTKPPKVNCNAVTGSGGAAVWRCGGGPRRAARCAQRPRPGALRGAPFVTLMRPSTHADPQLQISGCHFDPISGVILGACRMVNSQDSARFRGKLVGGLGPICGGRARPLEARDSWVLAARWHT